MEKKTVGSKVSFDNANEIYNKIVKCKNIYGIMKPGLKKKSTKKIQLKI
jgi:hypothetical protein